MKLTAMLAAASVSMLLASGCSTLQNLTTAQVPAKTIIVAANGLDGLIATAGNYVAYCAPNPSPAGCSDAAVQKLIPAVHAAQDARNSAEQFVADHPGQLGPQGLLDSVTTATSTIQSILSEFNINKG